MRGPLLIMAAVAVVAALAGAGTARWLAGGPPAPAALPADDAPAARPGPFTLPDLAGRDRSVSEWAGQVLLVNFWATWCPPCRREMPLLVDLQDELGSRGLQVVGVAIDEPGAVRDFVADHAIDFPVLVGGEEAIRAARDYGNRQGALPYSVVIDRSGRVAGRFPGELTRDRVAGLLEGLL